MSAALSSVMTLADPAGTALSAGTIVCIGFGIATLFLAALAVVEGTHDATRRRLYRRLLSVATAVSATLAALILFDAQGLLPRWVIGAGFGLCFALGIPALLLFNRYIRLVTQNMVSQEAR